MIQSHSKLLEVAFIRFYTDADASKNTSDKTFISGIAHLIYL